eukprot:CAMPEP_0185776884 /NCGR_PEP_ID=MMETSP1174-20130828/87454_1 /TAXON_ID=35687 /ORGANISM="Dictyocha speculum, Strain CCMP1381" /LENGTH=195 /DNA_ID=CAMNT_0028465053 /DNA_START=73 /DNA_END=660 /DNA_ORIENTATION=+
MAVHVRREASENMCSTFRRRVICPLVNFTITTDEIIGRTIKAVDQIGVQDVYLIYSSNNDASEKEGLQIMESLIQRGYNTHSSSDSTVDIMFKLEGAYMSPFRLSLVEQELSVSAMGFLPTDLSSWSNTVVLDRRARGKHVMDSIDSTVDSIPLPKKRMMPRYNNPPEEHLPSSGAPIIDSHHHMVHKIPNDDGN